MSAADEDFRVQVYQRHDWDLGRIRERLNTLCDLAAPIKATLARLERELEIAQKAYAAAAETECVGAVDHLALGEYLNRRSQALSELRDLVRDQHAKLAPLEAERRGLVRFFGQQR